MTINWEYMVRVEKWSDEAVWLSEAGREGWELVTAIDWSEGKGKYFLKRPVRSMVVPQMING